ncbi:hypothetical protein ACU4GD_08595 [Cupriavidus basilensis]
MTWNPATGEEIATVAAGGEAESQRRGGGGQGSLSQVGQLHPPRSARKLMRRLADLIDRARAAPGRAGNPGHRPADRADRASS